MVQMLVMAGWLKGCAPDSDNFEGMRTTVRHSMWCIFLLRATVLFLLFVMSVMVFNIQKVQAPLSHLRKNEEPMRLAGEREGAKTRRNRAGEIGFFLETEKGPR